jgi:uncharacterized Ntn-hydrolase superfamily protein
MTFSIVARDPDTGDFGVAVASKFLAAGSVVSHARALVGGIATQALANYTYGPDGLALLAQGASAQEVIDRLTAADENRDHRQLGIVDARGRAATYTGSACIDWAGGRIAEGVTVQGNILAGPAVVDAMLDAYLAPGMAFHERLVAALSAADESGGDRRGRQSAAVMVRRENGGYGGNNDSFIDLRVDDDPSPIERLREMLGLLALYRERPRDEDLLPLDEGLADELRGRLRLLGVTPETVSRDRSLSAVLAGADMPRAGEPRQAPDSWDAGWDAALTEWISVENLEERATSRGWVDSKTLEHLRRLTKR